MQEENRIPFVILNVPLFIQTLKKSKLIYGLVNYYNPKKEISNFAWYNIYHGLSINLAFQKEEKFKYQREFRIVKDISTGQVINIPFIAKHAYVTNMYWLKTKEFKIHDVNHSSPRII